MASINSTIAVAESECAVSRETSGFRSTLLMAAGMLAPANYA
jgi:hypothetical protein